jgi:hypothetical protein
MPSGIVRRRGFHFWVMGCRSFLRGNSVLKIQLKEAFAPAILGCLLIGILFFAQPPKAYPSEGKSENWFIGPRIGVSSFTGLLGLEMQYKRVGVSVGIPNRAGARYYVFHPGHAGFIGIFGSKYGFQDDHTIENQFYTDRDIMESGAGIGYRWRWGSGWDLEAGLSTIFKKEISSGRSGEYIKKSIFLFPILAFGYSF